jgi:hypothetical protein
MVVVSLEPVFWLMERAGMATGTRKVARNLWGECLPQGDRLRLVKELYQEENREKTEPSGSQAMIGLIYPGISRLDFDINHEDGLFPCHIESNCDPAILDWLQKIIYVVAIAPRPEGYNPLGTKNLNPDWIKRLGLTGKDCFDAILERDIRALGRSMNQCMECWESILPGTVRHPTIRINLSEILKAYQAKYPGAMYSGCGGGYLYAVSEEPVPGGFQVQIRK